MKSYLSLYRKWRPRVFSDFTGQQHVIKTLKNAIAQNKISHAYLFAGPRGTGKTSTAKVFSKAINCQQDRDTPEPCNECSSCKQIEQGNAVEIFEIDAASNRGIDEIRQLRENVKFPPTLGHYKVYIIDEVHMLTTEAFNALLKTLEEPPSYIIFIMATTEPHKLLPTILSRCQRFDFKYLTVKEILKRLDYICQEEEIMIERKALNLIARSAEGGMRDALSLLDQVLVYGVDEIDVDLLSSMLGIIKQEVFTSLTRKILDQETSEGLLLINSLIDEGKDVEQIIKGLIFHFRNLLMLKECGSESGIVDLPPEDIDQLQTLTDSLGKERLLSMINMLSKSQGELRWTNQPIFILERCYMELAGIEEEKQTEYSSLQKRIDAIEAQLRGEKAIKGKRKESKKKSESAKKLKKDSRKNISPAKTGESKGIAEKWKQVMAAIQKEDIHIHACLKDCESVSVEDGTLLLVFKHEFHWNKIKKNSELLDKIIKKELEKDYNLQLELKGKRSDNPAGDQGASTNSSDGSEKKNERHQQKLQEKVIRKALKDFNGEIIERS